MVCIFRSLIPVQQVCVWFETSGVPVSSAFDVHSFFNTMGIFIHSHAKAFALGGTTSVQHVMVGVSWGSRTLWVSHQSGCGPVQPRSGPHHNDILYHGQVKLAHICRFISILFRIGKNHMDLDIDGFHH